MFERTIEAQALGDHGRHGATVSFAIVAHLAVFLMVAIAGTLNVPPIKDPPFEMIFTLPIPVDLGLDRPPQPPKPPKPPAAPQHGDNGHAAQPKPPAEPPRSQTPPEKTPDTLPQPSVQPPGEETPTGPSGPVGESNDGPPGRPDGNGHGPGEGNGTEDAGPAFVTAEMTKPVLVVKIEPVYPEVARIARLPGRVTVQAVIGLDGSVESVEILSSSNPIFNDAALAAVRQWKYRPAAMSGRPVRVFFTVAVTFVIR